MRYFRRLPPLLRVASVLGWLLPLAAIGLMIYSFVTGLTLTADRDAISRLVPIAGNLILFGRACFLAASTYSARFRWPDQGPVPLDSWQSQLRLVLRSALPLCGIA